MAMKLRGWWLVLWSALAIGAGVAALLVASPDLAGVRAALRLTARTSVSLFVVTFAASSIQHFTRGGAGKWLLANRRYLGVSFAVSHGLHAVLIGVLVASSPEFRATLGLRQVGGTIAYLLLVGMTVTSFDRTTRWLGRKRWKVLHKTGMYVLWGVFATVYVPAAAQHPLYALPAAALVAALGIRGAARLRLRAPRRSPAT
jgi:DMSO/TMAO reductase YedYZ heme-binding membrane subunit